MRVWLVTVGEPLPLLGNIPRLWRTGLLAQLLVQRGHEVVWWTSTVNHFKKQYHYTTSCSVEVASQYKLHFLHGCLYGKNISLSRWRNHKEIALEFRRCAALQTRPDAILCSYPTIELSREAVQYGTQYGIPVLLDIRDLWPDEMEMRFPRPLRRMARWLLRSMYRDARIALQGAAGITAISDHYLTWAIKLAERERCNTDGVFTHGYPAPTLAHIEGEITTHTWLRQFGLHDDRKVFWFIGTFVGSIDLGTVIEAARILSARQDVVFVLSGSGERDAEWRAQANGLGNVIFTGWLDATQLSLMAQRAWVGLGAYKKGALMSLTNKLFEYMAYGLPILVCLPGEARTIIERACCGLYYTAGQPTSLAEQVAALADMPARRNSMALQAKKLFDEEYSAGVVYNRLADHLERVVHE